MTDAFSTKWNATSLRTKMTTVSVLLLTIGLCVAGLGSISVLRNYLTGETDHKIDSLISTLNGQVLELSYTTDGIGCNAVAVPDYYIAVLDESGAIICDNITYPSPQPDPDAMAGLSFTSQDQAFTVQSSTGNGQWRIAGLPKTTPNNEYLTLIVGQNLAGTDVLISRFAAIFLFFGLTVVILGGALTRLLVTSTFNPLREVEATAARFAAGDFSQRLGGATPNTEVGRFNRSLNAMLARIDLAFADRARTIDQMRRFVGDASHELRTPLVSVRGYAELYRMGALTTPDEVAQAMQRIEKEAIRMGELVTDLLELARIDEAKPLQLAEVDLIPLANDAALDTMAFAPGREVRDRVRGGDTGCDAARRNGRHVARIRQDVRHPRHRPHGVRRRHLRASARTQAAGGRGGHVHRRCRADRGARTARGRARGGEQDPPGAHQPARQRPALLARGHPDRDPR